MHMSKRGIKSGVALLSPEGARSATGGERLGLELSLYLQIEKYIDSPKATRIGNLLGRGAVNRGMGIIA